MKKFVVLMLLVVCVLFVCACEVRAADKTDWKKLYIDYINENPADDPEMSNYYLIYINDDNIPELLISYGFSYEGCDLCTVSEGKWDVLHYSNGELTYIERQNLFHIDSGRMDIFHNNVYRIQNGKFVRLHTGDYGAEDNANVQCDANGDPIYRYYWEGKEVSEKEYEQALSSVFDSSKAIHVYEKTYTASKIIPAIKGYK